MLDDLEESLEPLHGEPWAATTPHQPAIRPDQTRPDTQQTLRYHPQISTSLPTALFPKPPLPEYSYLVGAILFAAIESAPPCPPPLESNTDIVSIALQHFSSQRALPPLQVVAAHHHQRPLLSRPGRRACRLHTVASHCAECAWCTPRSQTSQTSQTPRRRYLQDPLKDDKTPRRLPLVRAQSRPVLASLDVRVLSTFLPARRLSSPSSCNCINRRGQNTKLDHAGTFACCGVGILSVPKYKYCPPPVLRRDSGRRCAARHKPARLSTSPHDVCSALA